MSSMLLNQIGKGKEVNLEAKGDIKEVKVSQLQEHPNNFYDTSDISDLANDIKVNGLNTSITVRKLNESHPLYTIEKPYQILVGHRRVLASKENKAESINARIVEGLSDSEAYELLISDNALARKLKPYEELLQVKEMTELLEIRKKEENLLGRVRELVAQKLGMSTSSIGRHQKVSQRASDLVLEKIKSEELSISSASELVALSHKLQNEFIENYEEYTSTAVREYVEECTMPEEKIKVCPIGHKIKESKEIKKISSSRKMFEDYFKEIEDKESYDLILSVLEKMEQHYNK